MKIEKRRSFFKAGKLTSISIMIMLISVAFCIINVPLTRAAEPNPPSNFTATTVSTSQIDLSWINGTNSNYTRIQRNTGSYPLNISDGTNIYNGTGTSTSDTSLSSGTKYYYRAWSWNTTDKLWSTTNATKFNTTWSIPLAPTGFTATTVSTTEINLAWTKGTNATHTRVQRNTGAFPVSISDGTDVYNSTAASCSDSGLTPGILYYYRAWSWNSTRKLWSTVNASAYNTTWSIPLASTGFTATTVSSNKVNLTWTKGTNATHTRVMQKTGSYPTNISDGSFVYNNTGTACSNSSLAAGTKYYFRAWSWNSTRKLWSTANVSAFNTTWGTPLVPTVFTATTVSTSQINLTWTKGTNATHTRIQRNTGSYPVNISSGINVYNGTGASYSNTSLTAGITYYYRAWSWNSTRKSWSTSNVSAYNITNPLAPTGFTAAAVSTAQINLAWTKGTNATYTRIQRNTGSYPLNISDGNNAYNGTGTSTSDTSLSSGTKYYYRAWSWNTTDKLWSTNNASAYATTQTSPPPPAPSYDPTAIHGGPYTGTVGTAVQFDGSGSTAFSGRTISTYSWSFGDGATGTGAKPTHTYTTAGTYTVTLTVTDNLGSFGAASTTAKISALPTLPSETIPDQTMNEIEEDYGVTLETPFYANDTDGDGIVDSFTDPNNVLTNVNYVNISGNASFLISTNDDNIPEFFWDTTTNDITPITHTTAQAATEPEIDQAEETITIKITVNKTESNWIYMDVSDAYPDYALTVKTSDGRIISDDKIWRENGKIYILDDPDTIYDFVYGYIVAPTFNPTTGTTFNTSKPTITITYQEQVTITTALFGTNDITDQITNTDSMVFTFTAGSDIADGTYTLSITAEDGKGNKLESTATYTIETGEEPIPSGEFPLTTVIVAAIIVIIVILLIIALLFKTGYISVQAESAEKPEEEPAKKPTPPKKK